LPVSSTDPAAAPPRRPPLHLEVIAFAHRLMDVRTRLLAQALASDPELIVNYGVPLRLNAHTEHESDEDARKRFPGFVAKKPYLRVTPQPSA